MKKPHLMIIVAVVIGGIVCALWLAHEPAHTPSPVGKDQVLKMASGLTNGMPEQIADKVFAERGLKLSSTEDYKLDQILRYNFTNGWLELHVAPKYIVTPGTFGDFTNRFLYAASIHWWTNPITSPTQIHAISLSLTNAP